MKVKFKKFVEHAVTPIYAHEEDACVDLYAIDSCRNLDYSFVEYGTGLAISVPQGHIGLLFPRSSISKTPHSLCNAVGVIDPGYFGEVTLRMRYKKNKEDMEYQYGDRIGQLMIIPRPKLEFEEVEDLGTSERGTNGWGSTGK